MKHLLLLFLFFLPAFFVQAQYTYTIKADSIRLTSNCDTSEFILENNSQAVSGFLFNKGVGRTEFRKMMFKINDSTYLLGGDTLKTVVKGSFVKINTTSTAQSTAQTGSYNLAGNGTIGGSLKVSNIKFALNSSNDNFIAATATSDTLTGSHNWGISSLGLNYLGNGNYNTVMGAKSLLSIQSGNNNSVFGEEMLYTLTAGNDNTAVGKQALPHMTSGDANVGLGVFVHATFVTGSYNTAGGFEAGGGQSGGYYTTYFGYRSGGYLQGTLNSNNTGVGYMALGGGTNNSVAASDSQSVAIGYIAGYMSTGNTTQRASGVFLGSAAGNGDTVNNRLAIATSSTNKALWGDMAIHHYSLHPASSSVDYGYTLDVQNGGTTGSGTFHTNGLLTAAGGIRLVTGGNDSAGAIPIRDSATGNLVNLAPQTNGQVLFNTNSKPAWGYANASISNILATDASTVNAVPEYGIYNLKASGNVAFILPVSSGSNVSNGSRSAALQYTVMIASASTGTVTVNVNAADSGKTINGSSAATFTGAYVSKEFYTDGLNWFMK